ncbi:MAG: GreA/GreB family elongation factor [Bacteroidota bacterium]
MSRGFVKESDQEELPIIPPRAPLPSGTTNYVTPTGLAALQAERDNLREEIAGVPTDDEDEHRRTTTVLEGKLALLQQRLTSARVIDPANSDLPEKEIRFGSTVTMEFLATGKNQTFQIVGVDEANVKEGKIAFTAPLARALTGVWVGETARFTLGGKERRVKILAVN